MHRKVLIAGIAGLVFVLAVVGVLYYLGGKPPEVYSPAALSGLSEAQIALLSDSGTVVKAGDGTLVYTSDKTGREVIGVVVPDAVFQQGDTFLPATPEIPKGTRIRLLISGNRVLAVYWDSFMTPSAQLGGSPATQGQK